MNKHYKMRNWAVGINMLEKLKMSIIFQYLAQLLFRYKDAELSSLSAQITYYLILSFFPFLIFLINLLSFTSLSSELLFANFNVLLPNDTGVLVKDLLVQTLQVKNKTLLFISMIISLWFASEGASAMILGLNKSYGVEETRNLLKLYFIALMSTFGITITIILEFTMIVFGEIIGAYIFELIGEPNAFVMIWPFLRYIIPFVVMLIVFSLIYRYLPNKKLQLKSTIIGAVFATVGWASISLLFSFYVNNFANYGKIYGSLGGVIALIIWLKISTLTILLGGELISIRDDWQNKE
jgi:membrane protein